jgi:hypothetical protein
MHDKLKEATAYLAAASASAPQSRSSGRSMAGASHSHSESALECGGGVSEVAMEATAAQA